MLDELLDTSFGVTSILITSFFILLTYYLWSHYKSAGLPPGPKGWPIVGYVPYLKGLKLHVQLRDIADKYGDIFCIYLGRRPTIVLNSYDSIKEAFVKQKHIFSARAFKPVQGNAPITIFAAEGQTFRDYKRFILGTLKEFGFGKNSLEPRIQEEIQEMLKEISNLNEKPSDIGNLMKMSVSNVICTLLNGKRYEYDDKTFQNIIYLISEQSARANFVAPEMIWEWLKKIPGYTRIKNHYYPPVQTPAARLMEQLTEHVQHRMTVYESGQKDDFINAWFTEKNERKKTNTQQNFSDQHLTCVVMSLFSAGTDTTANTLRWTLLYLIANPEIQAEIHKEIDNVIGHEKMPSLSDREQMPHVEAVLQETHRISTLAPLALFHSNSEETKLRNYTIPKRSIIIPNLWAVHHDPTFYPEPDKFLPFKRFLDSDDKVVKSEHLIPFSLGKRQCLGKPLAEMELFLYFTAMFQRFEFKLPDDENLTFDYDTMHIIAPKPFKLIAIDRKKRRN